MVQDLHKGLLGSRRIECATTYRRVRVWSCGCRSRRRDGVQVEFTEERPAVDASSRPVFDLVTGWQATATVPIRGIVHYSKIAKPWAEHELHMEIWRWERQQKLAAGRNQGMG